MEAMGQIREGMRVLDANGEEVGTVKVLKMGDPVAATAEGQTAGTLADSSRISSAPCLQVSDQQRERLLRLGYKVNRDGLFRGDLFVASDDIERVSGDSVHLAFTPG